MDPLFPDLPECKCRLDFKLSEAGICVGKCYKFSLNEVFIYWSMTLNSLEMLARMVIVATYREHRTVRLSLASKFTKWFNSFRDLVTL